MVSVLIYSKTEQESAALKAAAEELIAKLSEDYWEIRQIRSIRALQEYLSGSPLLHLLIYDISEPEALGFLAGIRKRYPHTRLMVLADISVSPMEYIRPDLKVGALLLKPWTTKQAFDALYGFLEEYNESVREKAGKGRDFYVIETREGIINIPFAQIYFFESRAKKIYVCTGKEEYGFYSSIEKLQEGLPDNFVRCHRGFIINIRKIRKIVSSQNMIYLADGFAVPLSRSYKTALKEMGRS